MTSSQHSNRVIIVADPIFREHLTGFGHPEQPKRYDAIMEALSDLGISVVEPRKATVNEIALCHNRDYIALVQREVAERSMLSTGDAMICPASYEIALKAAGAVLVAVDSGAWRAFCVVRPPGHHATKNQGMGFCIFNNIAIGARYAQKVHGIKRVLIVDWDVHHGNGTEDIFYDDPSVFYFSTHQSPLYPGTGLDSKETICNVPIQGGAGARERILEAFRVTLTEKMETFQPELVMISAGFDAHKDDPIGGCDLTVEDYAELTRIVGEIADRYAEGRIISVLEGGYDLEALGACARAHARALTGPTT